MKYLAAAAALLVLASSACTSNNTSSAQNTQAAQEQYCSDLNLLKTDILALQALGPTSSVGQLREGVSKVQDDITQLSKSAKALNNAKVDQLSTSYQNLARSVQGVSDSTSITAAVATVTPQLAAVKDAQSQQLAANCK
jgi:hypothetical protein